MSGLTAPPPHRPSPGGSAARPLQLGICPPPHQPSPAGPASAAPVQGGTCGVNPSDEAARTGLPQNAPSRPPSRVFLPRGSPRGSVRGCSWRGSREAVRSGRGALIRRARSCGSTGFTRPRAHIAQRDAFHDEVLHSDRLGEPTQIPGFKPNQLGFLKPNRIDRRTVGRWIEIEFPSSDPQRR